MSQERTETSHDRTDAAPDDGQDDSQDTLPHDGQDTLPVAHPDVPWWAGIGPVGAVVLILLGVAAGLWCFLRLPGTPDVPAAGYVSAGKVVAIGLVLSGSAALSHFRSRASRTEDGT